MADPRQDPRIRNGLIAILVAMRVKAERERRQAEAGDKADAPVKSTKKLGWFG